jgi:hypothetical protein
MPTHPRKRPRCRTCGLLLTLAKIPNRGVVWAHPHGTRRHHDRKEAETVRRAAIKKADAS